MAYNSNSLIMRAHGAIEGSFNVWEYLTADSLNSVTASGYFSDGGKRGMLVGDIVWVVNQAAAALAAVKCQVSVVGSQSLGGTLTQNTTATIVVADTPNLGALPRNLVDGGDFTTNPWQRGTSFTAIAATAIYTADRFFVVGADASVSAKAARAAFSSVAGFSQAFRFGRTANASSLSAITVGQILESSDSIRTQGQQVTLSFWAASEANYSGGNLAVTLVQGNGTDQSAASALAGTWTAQSNVVSSPQAINATMTRYSFTGTVSTATTQIGVLLSYTPTGSAGAADSVLLEGVQLELGTGPSAFEHRDVELELALCQRYAFVVNEPVTGVVVGAAASTASNKLAAMIPLPTPMRAAPTVTVTAGSFVFRLAGADVTATGLAAGATHTVNMISVVASASVASNAASFLQGGNGTGSIIASAEY